MITVLILETALIILFFSLYMNEKYKHVNINKNVNKIIEDLKKNIKTWLL